MILQYDWGTPLYDLSIRLRNEILRKPLGLVFEGSDLEKEHNYLHFGIIDNCYSMIACLILDQELDNNGLQLKQMAVSESQQNKGIGSLLVRFVEKEVRELGFEYIILHARNNAVGFYEKLGYEIIGEAFIEVGIQHFKMKKKIFQKTY